MPRPSTQRLDRFLTNTLIGIQQEGHIADMVLPAIPANNESGEVPRMGEDHYRLDFDRRARSGPGHRIEWDADSVPFRADEYRLEKAVDDRDQDDADDPYDIKRDAAVVINQKIMLRKEKLVAGIVMTPGNYPTDHVDSGAAKDWDGAGDPIAHVQTGMNQIISQTGVTENRLFGACSYNVFKSLRTNTAVKEAYVNTVPGASTPRRMSPAQVAEALGLAGLEVGNTIEITSKRGAAVTAKAYVWANNSFAIYYRGATTGIWIPNFGYQIYPRITGFAGAQVAVDQYRDESISSDVVRGKILMDELVVKGELGYLFDDNVLTNP